MSKRAEDLARVLTGLCPEAYEYHSRMRLETEDRLAKAAALIDAELRKERERCRKTLRDIVINPHLRNSWDYDGLWQCDSGRWLDINELLPMIDAAILDDKEE